MTTPAPPHGTAGIAYVVWFFPKLSETFVIEELLALDRLGIQPLVLARERPEGEAHNARAEPLLDRTVWLADTSPADARRAVVQALRHPLRLLQCLLVVVPTCSRMALRNLYYGLLLAAEVERRGVRYLHAHMAGNAAEMAYVASRISGVPWGMTIHAVEIYIGRYLCRKLRSAALRVTVCDYNIGQLRQRCPEVGEGDYVIKYAGLDASEFALTEPRPLRPARDILAVGRLTPKKGFDQLIEAVAALVAEGRDVRCRIVGEGGPKVRASLEHLIADLGLDGIVTLVGALAPREIRALMVEADLVAAPCTIAPWGDRDSMPVVIKEAMAMELPVVASNDFGIPEMVVDGSGVLFPRDDVPAFTDALRTVLDMPPEDRAAMGARGRQVVVDRFDEAVGARVLASAFAGVLGQGQEEDSP